MTTKRYRTKSNVEESVATYVREKSEKVLIMENYHPNKLAHDTHHREQFMNAQKSKVNRKGGFTKSLQGRQYTDHGMENAKRHQEAKNRQKKRLATLEEHTKNVAKLQEEALEVQAQLEEIQHRNR